MVAGIIFAAVCVGTLVVAFIIWHRNRLNDQKKDLNSGQKNKN